ncbi:MAG: FHA domain-containing protein [Planctomycetota bacterium]
MAKLLIIAQDRTRTEIELGTVRQTIGRGETADIIIADDNASRLHIEIEPSESSWIIRELGSRNGTWLNGERFEGERPFRPGDVARIGLTLIALDRFPADVVPSTETGSEAVKDADPVAEQTAAEPVAAPPSSGYQLRLLAGDATGFPRIIRLDDSPVLIGRKPDNTISLPDKNVSSRHATIRKDGETVVIEDLDSMNGVLVASPGEDAFKKVKQAILAPGARFRIAGYLFIFEPATASTNTAAPDAPPASAQPAPVIVIASDSPSDPVPAPSPVVSEPPANAAAALAPDLQTNPDKPSAFDDLTQKLRKTRLRLPALIASGVILLGLLIGLILLILPKRQTETPPVIPPVVRTNILFSDDFESQDDRGLPPGWRALYPVGGPLRVIQKNADGRGLIVAMDMSDATEPNATAIFQSRRFPVTPGKTLRASVDAMSDDDVNGLLGVRIRFIGDGVPSIIVPRVRLSVCPKWTPLTIDAVAPGVATEVCIELLSVGSRGVAMFDNARLDRVETAAKQLPPSVAVASLQADFLAEAGVFSVSADGQTVLTRVYPALLLPKTGRVASDYETALAPAADKKAPGAILTFGQNLVEYDVTITPSADSLALSVNADRTNPGTIHTAVVFELPLVRRRIVFASSASGVQTDSRIDGSGSIYLISDDQQGIVLSTPPTTRASLADAVENEPPALLVQFDGAATIDIRRMSATDQLRLGIDSPLVNEPDQSTTSEPPVAPPPVPAVSIEDIREDVRAERYGYALALSVRYLESRGSDVDESTRYAAALIDQLKRSLNDALAELERAISDAERAPSHEKLNALTLSLESLDVMWAGDPEAGERIEKIRVRNNRTRANLEANPMLAHGAAERAAELFGKAEAMIQIGQYALAEAFLRTVIKDGAGTPEATRAEALLPSVSRHVEARRREKLMLETISALERDKNAKACVDYVLKHPDWIEYGPDHMPTIARKMKEWGAE